jgi:hypothetical protein
MSAFRDRVAHGLQRMNEDRNEEHCGDILTMICVCQVLDFGMLTFSG